ncbi:MAG: matrixin family metalloprotease [bacterium]
MKKIFSTTTILLITLLLSGSAGASMLIPANNHAIENSQAPGNSPVINENWELERVDFIHYAKPDRPSKPDKNNRDMCYKLFGVKWKDLSVDYVINPTNPENLTDDFIFEAISSAAEAWDIETSNEVLSDVYTIDYTVEYGIRDYKNALVFGDYNDDNVIAVTSIWYTPRGKEIVESDILFNTRFDWGNADVDVTLMDLQNIAIHEIGHLLGLDDIYSDTCAEVTMYGYSEEGEIKKRTLEQSDIDGIQRLYGM